MEKKLVIIGGGGFTKVVINLIHEIVNKGEMNFKILCIFNDSLKDDFEPTLEILKIPIEKKFDKKWIDKDTFFVIAIGDPSIRRTIYEKYKSRGCNFSTLIHPTSLIGMDSNIGEGSILLSNSSVEPSVAIGVSCILNKSVVIGHDTIIGDFTVIHSNTSIAGDCLVKDEVLVGQNVSVRQGTKIGKSTTVGAGASVVANLPDDVVALGVPAKYI